MQPWLEFWNRSHRIYVNDRHQAAHYKRISRDLLKLLPDRAIDLLDWGCASAQGTPDLIAAGVRVTLFDKAPSAQQELQQRYQGNGQVRVLDNAAYAALPAASFDVILVNSVIQYFSEDEFIALLPEWHRLLRSRGRLLIGDVIPPDAGVVDDVRALLASGWSEGYFLAALAGLAATFFSDYRQLRKQLGLTTYRPARILELLTAAGFVARQLPSNIGFSPHRNLLEASPR